MRAVVRSVVGGVFIAAGVLKAWDPQAFQQAVDGFRLLPYPLTAAVALYLPWLEILAGALAIAGRWGARAALQLLTALTVLFLVALLLAAWRGLDPACGCFGPGSGGLGTALLRDVALLAALLWLLRPVEPSIHAADAVGMTA